MRKITTEEERERYRRAALITGLVLLALALITASQASAANTTANQTTTTNATATPTETPTIRGETQALVQHLVDNVQPDRYLELIRSANYSAPVKRSEAETLLQRQRNDLETQLRNASVNTSTPDLNTSLPSGPEVTAGDVKGALEEQRSRYQAALNGPTTNRKQSDSEQSDSGRNQLDTGDVEQLRKQLNVTQSRVEELKKENRKLRRELRKLRQAPITAEDILDAVREKYTLVSMWATPALSLAFVGILLYYRRGAQIRREQAIEDAADQVREEQRHRYFSQEVASRSIAEYAESDMELQILDSLGIQTVRDLQQRLDEDEGLNALLNDFSETWSPSPDLEEHFEKRLKELKRKLHPETLDEGDEE